MSGVQLSVFLKKESKFFFFFERKISFSEKMPKILPKTGFLIFAKKLIHSCLFFYPKVVPKRVLCDSRESTCLKKSGSKILSANQIAVVFDHQYIWKESSGILVILHRVGLQVKAAFEKAVVWLDVVRFPFHAIRLHDSLIIDILGENQVIYFFIYFLSFFMHAVSNQGKVAFETTSFGCVWSVMLLVELDCRIPWSTSSLERIILFLSFLWSYSSREGRDYRFWLSLASYYTWSNWIAGFFGHQYLWKDGIYTFV